MGDNNKKLGEFLKRHSMVPTQEAIIPWSWERGNSSDGDVLDGANNGKEYRGDFPTFTGYEVSITRPGGQWCVDNRWKSMKEKNNHIYAAQLTDERVTNWWMVGWTIHWTYLMTSVPSKTISAFKILHVSRFLHKAQTDWRTSGQRDTSSYIERMSIDLSILSLSNFFWVKCLHMEWPKARGGRQIRQIGGRVLIINFTYFPPKKFKSGLRKTLPPHLLHICSIATICFFP